MCADARAITDASAGLDHGERTNVHALADHGRRVDAGLRVKARRRQIVVLLPPPLGEPGEGQVGVVHHDAGSSRLGRLDQGGRHQQGRRLGGVDLPGVAGVRDKR